MADRGHSPVLVSDEHDLYIAQLKEVFQSCSQTGSDSLTRSELTQLCDRLQLQDQAQYIVDELLKDKQQVKFEEFKDTFVTILCEMMPKQTSSDEETEESMLGTGRSTDGPSHMEEEEEEEEEEQDGGMDDEEEDDENDDDEEEDEKEDRKEAADVEDTDEDLTVKREMSPKYIVGKKRYGRRSLPVSAEDFACLADDEEDVEVASSTQSLKRSLIVDEMTDTEEDSDSHHKHRRRDGKDTSSEFNGTETFEGEGQLNLQMADMESSATEERYVQGIWDNLGVGKNGYINIAELARVCNLIGMEKMDESELQQLFNKLDADRDGRVSFKEFLSEMFQHNTPSTSATGPSPSLGSQSARALSAQKKLKFPGTEDRTTPSIVQGAGVTGLFSVLDPERSGFAKPDAIIELWEKSSVSNGADVLLGLGFDLNSKVNLSDLSSALEQELVSVDEQSIVYQAAAVTFQQEIRTLKSSLEQAVWAKEKLKLDLAEANARNNLLAKEVDERHASMEKSSESKLLSIEKKYQDQVRSMQSELDKEREHFSVSSALSKQRIEEDMEELRQEEIRLREQLTSAQKEIQKVGRDLEETSYKFDESRKHNSRLQRELDNMDELNKKLAEYEGQSLLDPEQQKFAQQKLQRLEQENKDLRDVTDELTAELETLKQQMMPARKPAAGTPDGEDQEVHTPIRKDGSILADYIKPKIIRRESFSSADYSDDDAAVLGSVRRSGHREDDSISLGSDKETVSQLKADIEELKNQFEVERKQLEHGYRLEITDIEERQDREKEQLLAHIETEKKKIAEEFDRLQQQALAELAKDLQTNFVHEKENLVQKHETEKNHIEQMHVLEKQKLIDRITRAHEDDLQAKVTDLSSRSEEDIYRLNETIEEKNVRLEHLKNQVEEIEDKVRKQRREMEDTEHKHKAEIAELVAKNKEKLRGLENEQREIEYKLKHQVTDEEDSFRKIKLNLNETIDKQNFELSELKRQLSQMEIKNKQEMSSQELQVRGEKLELSNEIDKLRQDIRELQRCKAEGALEMKQQREELELAFKHEKQELKELYDAKLQELEDKLEQEERKRANIFHTGVEGLTGQLREDFFHIVSERTTEETSKELNVMRSSTEKQQQLLQQDLETKESELSHIFEREKTELIEKYEHEIQRLREELQRLEEKLVEEREALAQRYEDERNSIEDQVAHQIRDELEDEFVQQMEEIKEAFEDERHEFDTQTKLLQDEVEDLRQALEREERNKRKHEELKKAHGKLQQEKKQIEKTKTELESKLDETRKSLEARIDELTVEKEGALTAVKAQFVETSKQSGKEKACLDMVTLEKEAMEKRVNQLTEEVTHLHGNIETQQRQIDELMTDKQELTKQLQEATPTRVHLHPPVPEHAQRAINELTKEKSELQDQLVDTQARLTEVEETAKKYSHLQFDFGQMTIGQCALEDTLAETQDKLADTGATLRQAERELKDALRYKDKYKLLQKKYEDVSRDRDKATQLVKTLKEQLNEANAASKEDNQDKGQLASVLEEKKQLESQLQLVSDKLFEATSNFAASQSSQIRELQQWKEQSNNMVDLQKYTKLQIDLVDNQRTLRDLQEAISNKDEIKGKEFKETVEKHTEEVKGLADQKIALERQLKVLQDILDGQIDKLRDQYEASEKRNALVVDLYKENADLMHSLYRVEEQKKDAVARCYKLEDQCNNLRHMLKRLAKAAVA